MYENKHPDYGLCPFLICSEESLAYPTVNLKPIPPVSPGHDGGGAPAPAAQGPAGGAHADPGGAQPPARGAAAAAAEAAR